ncbi:MAG: sterol homeostasis protein [Candelina mexicana]|nr:MAG: sterol homeostasis protein [Candelina mexicana]
MPICIECRFPVQQLCITYSKASDRLQGEGVRLTQCPRCKRFADKYIEHDFVVLFIDLVLIKPQPSIIRLGVLLLLFDVYLTWARIEKATPPGPPSPLPTTSNNTSSLTTNPGTNPVPNTLSTQPILLQYTFFLLLCLLSTLSLHLTTRLISTHLLHYPRPNSVSTALLVSSCTKLFPILMVIWDYDVPAAAKMVGWAVLLNNIEALKILLDCGYLWAAGLAGAGAAVRVIVGWVILRAVGLEEGARGSGVVGDFGEWGWRGGIG